MPAYLTALVAQGGGGGAGNGAFEPFLPGLIVLLPLLGALANGALALVASRGQADTVRAGGEPELPAPGSRPATHTLPTWIGPGVLGLAFLITLVNFVRMLAAPLAEPVVVRYWTWMATGAFSVDAALQLDQLSMVMTMIVTGVGFLIHVFSVGYMRDDLGYPRYFSYLNLFVFFMLVLVMGSSYPLMFVGWEGVGLCSYLLIGFWFTDREKSDAGKKAFVVNRIGDVGFLVAMFLLFSELGTLDFVPLFAQAEELAYGGAFVTAVTLFFLLGAVGKSAQIPLYVWLPDAMAGPTPVSALIHAATMVTAGVYLVARSSLLYALSPVGSATVAGIGVLTALFAATIALQQNDIKKVLAYSTVSQLGYMFVGVGVGAYAAGIFHLMTHAFFKALLFLGSGAVIHAMHHAYHATHSHEDAQDMRNMGGLAKHMPITCATMWIGTLAIAGVWPFAGFFSKDEIIWQVGAFGGAQNAPYPLLYSVYWVIALGAALLTAFYMTRMMVLTFHGQNRTGAEEARHLHEVGPVMWVPLVVLAFLSFVGGWVNVPEALGSSVLGLGGLLPTSEWLHHWLEPVTEAATEVHAANLGALAETAPAGGGEVLWAILSTLAALAVVAGAFRFVGRQDVRPAVESTEPTGFAAVLYNKYYVDELYDRLIVQPVLRASRFAWRVIDATLIDGVVNAVGLGARALGWGASLFQTGTLNAYAFVFAVGVLILLGASLL
ncbi:MAG TPA: NADH-quinone oxidoreductase subunit L [Longimicrobiales bacterium]|nr:NADH-quinone oxidoreductase subunit L [Longimicrobiales bacterium]